jgi:hypothetical protein
LVVAVLVLVGLQPKEQMVVTLYFHLSLLLVVGVAVQLQTTLV